MLADMMRHIAAYEIHLAGQGGGQDVGMYLRLLCCHLSGQHAPGLSPSPLQFRSTISLTESATNAIIVV